MPGLVAWASLDACTLVRNVKKAFDSSSLIQHLAAAKSRLGVMMRVFLFVILFAWPPASPVLAHGGGLNAQGCHNDRKRGDYHCHRGSASGSSTKKSKVGGSAYYANCAAARAAGAAPVNEGDPGYSRRLDRDGDGVGCE
jgi:hypothetical protein